MCIQNGVLAIISKVKNEKKKKWWLIRSLRVRISICMLLIGLIPSIIVAFCVVQSYENRAVELRGVNVKNQCDILCNKLAETNYLSQVNDPSMSDINSQLMMLSNVYNGRIVIMDSDFVVVKDTYDMDVGRISITEEVIDCYKGNGVVQYDSGNKYIEMTIPIYDMNRNNIMGVMLMSVSTNEIATSIAFLEIRSIMFVGIIGVFIFILSTFLSGALVKPISKVTRSIEDITDGFLDGEISVPDYTETELITNAFNRMLSRLKTLDDSRQEFVSNVSHELKTPLTSMKVLADSLVGQENIPIELYQEFMQDIVNEIDRENRIITDLLNLVKMDKKDVQLNIEAININAWIETTMKRLHPLADKRNIALVLESNREIVAEIDEVKLTLALSNLVENGIKYNSEGGWVHVTLDSDHKYFYITVQDNGMGIPEDSIDHIFERFYRVDKSHSTRIEGTGLGLSITRNAIIMHRGTIRVNSVRGEGTTFSIKIPLSYRVEGGRNDA